MKKECCRNKENFVECGDGGAYCGACGCNISYPKKTERHFVPELAGTAVQELPNSSLHVYQKYLRTTGPQSTFAQTSNEFREMYESVVDTRTQKEALDLFFVIMTSTSSSHKGKLKNALLAVCLYMAYRKSGNEKPQSDIERMCRIVPRYFARAMSLFYKIFNQLDFVIHERDESQLIYFYCCVGLRLPQYIYGLVMKVHEHAKSLTLFTNRSLTSTVAGEIYFIVKRTYLRSPTLPMIDMCCHVKASTITKVYKRLLDMHLVIFEMIGATDGYTLLYVDCK